MSNSAAARIQQEREAADLANHIERIQWLEAERPVYSCGTPVDTHTRNALLLQSRTFVANRKPA